MARAPKIDEERPPHDALEGVKLPRQTTVLFGHQHAERALLNAYRSERMHHGWILAGERGIGKATLAFRLARFVFAHPDPAAREVATAEDLSVASGDSHAPWLEIGAHPNLLHLRREWDDRGGRYRSALSVEAIRRITPFLGTTAGEGGWRVVIVDPADDMTPSAANAILKNLEEPPKKTLFLLTARSRGALLPTILSRCRSLNLAPLTVEETQAAVHEAAPGLAKAGAVALAAALASGSPRRLIELQREGGVELYRMMRQAVEGGSAEAQLGLSIRASTATAVEELMDLYQGYLSRRVRGLPEPAGSVDPPAVPLVTWAELWEKATLSGSEVEEYNLDRRQFVLDLLETSAAALRQSGTPNL
jgi:DNA polymerase III subunit delta'